MLRHKPGWSQFLLFISIVLVSFVVLGSICTILVYSQFAGSMGVKGISSLQNLDYSNPAAVSLIRWLQVIQFFTLFVIPCFFCAYLFGSSPRRYLGLVAPSNYGYWIAGIVIMIVAIPFTNLLGEWNRHVQFPKGIEDWMKNAEEDSARAIRALMADRSISSLILNLFLIAGLAAIGEELLFRGMAQRLLSKMFKSPWAGIIIAAALFSAVHMQFYGFLPRFILGILLGAIYWYSGSLYASMLAHFVYDGVVIVIAYFYPQTMETQQVLDQRALLITGGLSAVIVIVIMIWMKKRSLTKYESVYADDQRGEANPFEL